MVPDERKTLRWDGTINIPLLVTAVGAVIGVIMWANSLYLNVTSMDRSVTEIKNSMKDMTKEISGLKEQNAINSEIRTKVDDHERRIREIERTSQ